MSATQPMYSPSGAGWRLLGWVCFEIQKQRGKLGLIKIGAPTAGGGAGEKEVALGGICRKVALGTKGEPLAARACAATKLGAAKYAHFLFMKLPDRVKFELCLLVIEGYGLKLKLKLAFLRLENLYLALCLGESIERQRKAFAKDVGHGDFLQSVAGSLEKAHAGMGSQAVRGGQAQEVLV